MLVFSTDSILTVTLSFVLSLGIAGGARGDLLSQRQWPAGARPVNTQRREDLLTEAERLNQQVIELYQ